jgi:hypothetical protein
VRVVDLSLRGCLLRTDSPLDEGAVVDLRLEMPDGALAAKARVAEASIDGDSLAEGGRRCLAGLEFLGLSAPDERRLLAFVGEAAKRRRGADPSPA